MIYNLFREGRLRLPSLVNIQPAVFKLIAEPIELELELIYLSGRVMAFRPFLPLNQSDTCTNSNKIDTKAENCWDVIVLYEMHKKTQK